MNKLSILIPAYNEANIILQTLRKIREVKLIDGFLKEVIIIYDCSIDETAINGLNFVTNLTDHIRFKANAKSTMNSNGQESIE